MRSFRVTLAEDRKLSRAVKRSKLTFSAFARVAMLEKAALILGHRVSGVRKTEPPEGRAVTPRGGRDDRTEAAQNATSAPDQLSED